MPNRPRPRDEPEKKRSQLAPRKDERQSEEEVLREQSMTETEARPYLDTEGGE